VARAWLVTSLSSLLCSVVACGQGTTHPAPAEALPVVGGADAFDVSPSADAGACVGVEVAAEALPVDLFAVVDRSGSMADATSTGVSKWYATKMAFHDFLEHAPSGMGFGLSLFPSPGSSSASCATEYYREQALPISDVQQMASGALARLDKSKPQGQTPTAPALVAALDLASMYALDHVERSVVVVLATDGLPTTCSPTDTAALGQLAKAALESPAHVRTLVVASRSLDGNDLSGFDELAAAGGTGRALSIDPRADFAAQLRSALASAATHAVACDLALPEPPPGSRLDYDAINVVLDGSKGRATLPRVAGPAECGAAGGWYYDVDPRTAAPARLNMCKSSCEHAGPLGTATGLRVELGCKSLVR
jgi:hypothetical protein